jgi:hypothetical protein
MATCNGVTLSLSKRDATRTLFEKDGRTPRKRR